MLQADVDFAKVHTPGSVFATGELQLPRGNAATARAHRDWLLNLPAKTGDPLTRIAQQSKISPSTLTRPAKEGDHGRTTLHANTIAKVVARYGVAPPAGVAGPLPKGARAGFGEDAAPYTPDAKDPLAAAVAALRGNSPAIAAWTLKTRALELAGYLPGDVVLVDLGNVVPAPGDVVCAQIYDWQRMRAETVMRVYERAAPVDLLVARSADPAFGAPLVVDGERVVIKGVVLPHRLRPAAKD